jgi:hypothetical protein
VLKGRETKDKGQGLSGACNAVNRRMKVCEIRDESPDSYRERRVKSLHPLAVRVSASGGLPALSLSKCIENNRQP